MAIASDMVKLPTRHIWLDYDKEADVLYMSFRKPQRATKTIEANQDILIRKDGREIVGLTIMNASNQWRIKSMFKQNDKKTFDVTLKEYIARKKQLEVTKVFGTIAFDKDFNYKKARNDEIQN